MTQQPSQSVICPVLVGRDAQLRVLHAAIERAGGGAGGVVLVSGEAGIGKSRLIAEAKRHASASGTGMRAVQGTCFEPDRSLPFAPFLDLLQSWCLAPLPDALIDDLQAFAPDLLKLVPDLASIFPGCAAAARLDPEQEQRRLFQALTHSFTRLAAGSPLLLVIEDVHWADDTSLALLLQLARRIGDQRILLLISYRVDEVGPQLAHLLAELDRQRLATELALMPLAPTDVAEMLRATFAGQRSVTLGFLHRLYQLTDGNPFYVEEVIKSLFTDEPRATPAEQTMWDHVPLSALRVPRGVQDVIQRRMARVGPVARDVLGTAAVVGQRFRFDTILALAELDEHALIRAMKELIAAQLIVELSEERFQFRHALTRQAIYANLLARERRALHRAVADTLLCLSTDGADPPIPELAYHFYAAGAWRQALDYAQQAAEQAVALYAPREAIEHFARAIDAAERLRGDSAHTAADVPPSALLARLHARRGECHETLGAFEDALSDYECALTIAEREGDRAAMWQTQIQLGMLWAGRDYAQSAARYERALALAREMDDPRLLGHSLNRIGNWRLNAAQPRDAVRLHREALAIFERVHDAPGMATTFDLLGMASYHTADLPASADYYTRAIAQLRALDDRQSLISSLSLLSARGGNLDLDPLAVGPSAAAAGVRAGEEAVRLAREIDWRAGEAFARFMLGMAAGARGDYALALEHGQTALAIAEAIEHRQWMTAAHRLLGHLHLDLLSLGDAQHHLERALALARAIDSSFWIQSVSSFLASTYILCGVTHQADTLLAAAGVPEATVETLGQQLIVRARIELALANHDPARALALVEGARAAGPPPGARLELLRAAALVAARRHAEAEVHLLALRERIDATGLRPLTWRVEQQLGALYRIIGRRGKADRSFQRARSSAAELVANLLDARLRAAFLEGVVRQCLAPASRARGDTASSASGGLTPREREVATLIGRGLSNGEIADALYVGKRTIETHISGIYRKLGYTSRTEIALWIVETGLPEGELADSSADVAPTTRSNASA